MRRFDREAIRDVFRLSSRPGSLSGSFLLCLLLAQTASFGAEKPSAPAPSGAPKQAAGAPAAVENSEIIPRAEQALRSLQEIRSELAADQTLGSVEKGFVVFAEASDRRRESAAEAITKSRSVQRLNEIVREWNIEQRQLEEWDQTLTQKSASLAALEKRVDQMVATWRATQASVAKKLFFKAVLERRVEEVLKEAEDTRAAIQQQTTRLLKLQGEVADRLANLAKLRKEIDEARQDFGRGLFALDSPPLWQALMDSAAQQTILAEAWDSPRRIWNDWRDFLAKYLTRIPWHLGLFLALVTFFHFLRRSSLAGSQGGADEFKAAVLKHPISSSLLLSLIPSAFFYPGAPAGVLRAVMAPMMLSIVILLPRLLSQKYWIWVRLLTALYLLEFLRSLLPEHWLLNRLLLLVIATVGCLAIVIFLRAEAAKQERAGFGKEIVFLSLRVGLVLFVVSILCNLIGNMIIAEMLPATLVRITYAGGVIYASAHLTVVLAMIVLCSRAAAWLRSVRTHVDLIGYRCRILILFVAAVFWVLFSLYIVGLLDQVRTAAAKLLEVRWQIGAAEISIQDIAVFVAVFLSALILSRLLRFLLADEILPRFRLPRGAPGAVDVLARYGVLLLGFVMALAAAGVDLSKVTLLISALGVGIGFGLQNVVNNFVSGLILVFEHPLQVGDLVEVGTTFGEVRKIGFRASVLRTPDGADVVIPNGELVGGRFVNWSLFDRMRRISISVGVAYGTDAKRVIAILEKVAHTHPAVFAHPAPSAVFDRFGESTLNFTLLCWSSVDEFFPVRSELTVAIQKAFTELGIEVPFPQQDVHLHWSKGAHEKALQVKTSTQADS
jgi:small-conductance mechanosensitive channel